MNNMETRLKNLNEKAGEHEIVLLVGLEQGDSDAYCITGTIGDAVNALFTTIQDDFIEQTPAFCAFMKDYLSVLKNKLK